MADIDTSRVFGNVFFYVKKVGLPQNCIAELTFCRTVLEILMVVKTQCNLRTS